MIDLNGFRTNVGIILIDKNNCLLWGKRVRQNAWQFPQGGINNKENIEDALFRELFEEIGLLDKNVSILACTKNWLKYRIPKRMVRDTKPICIGQKQKWYLLRLKCLPSNINLNTTNKPEFDGYKWVTYWYPLRQVISFKYEVYRKALIELAPFAFKTNFKRDKKIPLNYLLEN